MSKNVSMFLALVLFAVLVGCHSGGRGAQPTPMSTPSHCWTALEAYEQIKPAMLAWHEDAVVFAIWTRHDPRWRVRVDGTSPWWGFSVYSPDDQQATEIALQGEEVVVGIDGKAGYEIPMSDAEELPLDEMIDSDKAVEIALRNGVGTTDVLEEINTNNYDGAAGQAIPLSWELTYSPARDGAGRRSISINVVTGEVIRNDFAD